MVFTERELKIFKEIQQFAEKYQTKKVVLFGSRARRTNREKSDIDLAIYGCSDITDFYFDIEEKVNTLLMFDIIDMNERNISKDLLHEIERDGVIIYEEVWKLWNAFADVKESAKRLVNVIIMNYIPEFERVLDELKKIYGEMLYNI